MGKRHLCTAPDTNWQEAPSFPWRLTSWMPFRWPVGTPEGRHRGCRVKKIWRRTPPACSHRHVDRGRESSFLRPKNATAGALQSKAGSRRLRDSSVEEDRSSTLCVDSSRSSGHREQLEHARRPRDLDPNLGHRFTEEPTRSRFPSGSTYPNSRLPYVVSAGGRKRPSTPALSHAAYNASASSTKT
jgi:hypothetical protein